MNTQVGLSREQRRVFGERGLLKLEGLVARALAEQLADRLWAEMARRHAIRREDRATWQAERPTGFGPFQKTGAFNAMATPEVRGVLDEVIGPGWNEPTSWGLPLVCFPTVGDWELPHKVWHFDLTPKPGPGHAEVGRVFLLLAPLRPRGGGTLVAAGSHRLAQKLVDARDVRLNSQDLRKRLASAYPWFHDLLSPPTAGEDRVARFMHTTATVDGVDLQVEEMTGEPGDVLLMHPHVLHAGADNALDTPRLALTQFVEPKGWTGL